ncbi:hypothetical protein CEUSTIGMA_g6231.t1 [Chlamydomonas eustigma]|uniref:J domain-containing protein n=1 Tax=Chlamydomonas eustigma TaxID=1157962 RepID=A0A250X6S3_9CHLO|nr:hypothetical protein CEUSTIGMA_g6231.t1 [Chlamydomonas eustigma]|eukprot:GAX78794.1 hypothetical protein CEUSTIGMA_g6231.t1 [Chlamydomonas eustigma]
MARRSTDSELARTTTVDLENRQGVVESVEGEVLTMLDKKQERNPPSINLEKECATHRLLSMTSDKRSRDKLLKQLEEDRAAVTCLRNLLATHPAMQKELREMLYQIDHGHAADITGIQDKDLQAHVKKLLKHLGLAKSSKGAYGLARKDTTTLSVLGFVFDEPIQHAPAKKEAQEADGQPCKTGSRAQNQAPPVGDVDLVQVLGEASEGLSSKDIGDKDEEERVNDPKIIHPPTSSVNNGSEGMPKLEQARQGMSEEAAAATAAVGVRRRVMGPTAPSAAMLVAAAAIMKDVGSDGDVGDEGDGMRRAGWGTRGDGDGEDGDDMMVGPPPPELVLEIDAVPQDEREAEVFKIMIVLKDAANAASSSEKTKLIGASPAAAAVHHLGVADAYSVLGVPSTATSAEVKRRYMRLSLLIHPDKCQHADAHEAFQAVSKAAKVLQDSSARQELDAQLEDTELRRLAAKEAERQERERQWRIVQGLEKPGLASAGLSSSGERLLKREAWMTELPPERTAPAKINQVTNRTFSQSGIKPRGDTSAWTDSPEQAATRKAAALLGGGAAALLALGPATGVGPGMFSSDSAVDQYDNQCRRKTLVEEHLERLSRGAVVSKHAVKPVAENEGMPSGKAGERVVGNAFNKQQAAGVKSDSSSSSESESSNAGDSSEHEEQDEKKSEKRKREKEKDKKKKGKSKKTKNRKGKKKRKDVERGGKGGIGTGPVQTVVGKKPEWAGEHPWRPFDRDKDLELKPKAVNPQQLINSAAAMSSSRFQSAGGTRHFL